MSISSSLIKCEDYTWRPPDMISLMTRPFFGLSIWDKPSMFCVREACMAKIKKNSLNCFSVTLFAMCKYLIKNRP